MARNWIKAAVKKPGRVGAIAKREGGMAGGKIKMSWLKAKIARTKDKSLRSALVLAKRFKSKGGV